MNLELLLLFEQIPGSSDRLIVEHHLVNKPELRMAKAVQGWLQTIKLDEHYQTELKMSMAKLQPKRFYWSGEICRVTCRAFLARFQGEDVPFPQVILQ